MKQETRWGRVAFTPVVCALALAAGVAWAEQLPIRSYTAADGLPHDEVGGVVFDSAGFLWILTRGGLSRFDGHFFTNFGPDHGLPAGTVHDLLQTSDGEILVAAGDGVYLLDPSAEVSASLFRKIGGASVPSFSATVLIEGRSGTIWCGAYGGLYRLEHGGASWSIRKTELGIDFTLDGKPLDEDRFRPLVTGIVEDRAGTLWVGIRDIGGLVRLAPDRAVEQLTTGDGLQSNDLRSLLEDTRGRLWAGTSQGLCLLDPDLKPGAPVVSRCYTEDDGLAGNWIPAILEDSDGQLWFGTNKGLSLFLPAAKQGAPAFRSYTMANGLRDRWINALAEDREGNVWLGTSASGVMRLGRSGFTNYDLDDGLGHDLSVQGIFEDNNGAVCTVTGFGGLYVNCFDGRRFHSVRPNVPAEITNRGWGWNQIVFQDSAGGWWVPTFEGLFRFPPVERLNDLARVEPLRVYTKEDGLGSNQIFRLFEDSAGDVWIGTTSDLVEHGNTLHRWDRRTDTIDDCNDVIGLPVETLTAFAEGPDGELWIGLDRSGFGRLRGREFRLYTDEDGAPSDSPDSFLVDRQGRLWVATTSRGLVRIDDPEAAQPRFERYTSADGLAGDIARCIVEDRRGRIWVGSWSGGVSRLDPESGQLRSYTLHDGLPSHRINVCHRDRDGALWFGTWHGVSRLVPGSERDAETPVAWIRSIRVAGGAHRAYELGIADVAGLVLEPNQRELRLEYSALSFGPGEQFRFQYRLVGASRAWSDPGTDREVNFPNLAPGRYRFDVRAVNAEGLVSPEPATVAFRVLPPFWQRWWFMGLMAVVVGAVAYAFHRVRVRRMVELERVRTRIATDLHDDIGSSLSQVSILSEVVRQQVGAEEAGPLLEQIAGTARDLVDSMSDIVWSVNPKRDRAADLVQRMRRFASDTFSGRRIRFRLEAPESGLGRKLDVETRRQVYLIFKEAVHNAVRHSGCDEAWVRLGIDGNVLRLEVADDGRGFDVKAAGEGHGLESMHRRAEGIGGRLEVGSEADAGTTVRLRVPL